MLKNISMRYPFRKIEYFRTLRKKHSGWIYACVLWRLLRTLNAIPSALNVNDSALDSYLTSPCMHIYVINYTFIRDQLHMRLSLITSYISISYILHSNEKPLQRFSREQNMRHRKFSGKVWPTVSEIFASLIQKGAGEIPPNINSSRKVYKLRNSTNNSEKT